MEQISGNGGSINNVIYGELHAAARKYARAGIPVFPLQPCTKKPFPGFHGHKDASTDVRQIDDWWREHPNANIGADPHGCDCCVIDADLPFDRDWLRRLPRTWTIGTPRGGLHFWFEGELRNSIKELAPHTNSRGMSQGYVLLPPSRIEDKVYRVVRMGPVAALPAWVTLPGTLKPLANGHDRVLLDQPVNIHRTIVRLKRLPEVREGGIDN
jgi:hypothetical protein